MEGLCHCGLPLHYTDADVERAMWRLIGLKGERIKVTVGGRSWLVPRHYIALHGLRAAEIATLGFAEITNAATA
jgi:hypothetical protein